MPTPVAQNICQWNLIKINTTSSLQEAFLKMGKHRIRHLPVSDADGTLVGMISDRDLKRALRVDLWVGPGMTRIEECHFPSRCVADYMSWPVKMISAETPLTEVALRMTEEKLSSFIVKGKNGELGIITHHDLLKFMARNLKSEGDSAHESSSDDFETWVYQNPISRLVENLANSGI